MINGDEVARLIIYGVTPDDAGAYSITLSNAFGQASDVVNVNINSRRLFLFFFFLSYPDQLSLAIPSWVDAVSTGESWDVNRHNAQDALASHIGGLTGLTCVWLRATEKEIRAFYTP